MCEKFKDRLKQRREEMGYPTVAALAKRLKVDRKTAGNWENGKIIPKGPTLETLSVVLQVTPGWLLDGVEKVPLPTGSPAEPSDLSTQLALAIRLIGKLEGRVEALEDQFRRQARPAPEVEQPAAPAPVTPIRAVKTPAEPAAASLNSMEGCAPPAAADDEDTTPIRRYYRAAAGAPVDSERGADLEQVPTRLISGSTRKWGVVAAEGHSMDWDGICSGDLVLYSKRAESSGDMVLAQLLDPATGQPTGEHVIKRYRRVGGWTYLFSRAVTPEYEVQRYDPETEVKIMGVVVARCEDGEWIDVPHVDARELQPPGKHGSEDE